MIEDSLKIKSDKLQSLLSVHTKWLHSETQHGSSLWSDILYFVAAGFGFISLPGKW